MSHRTFDPPDKICEQGSALLASMLLHFFYNKKFLPLQDNQAELLSRIAEDGKIRITPLPAPDTRRGTKLNYWNAAKRVVFRVLETRREEAPCKWDLESLALSGDDKSNENKHTILTKKNGKYFPFLARHGDYEDFRIKHLCLHNLTLRLKKEAQALLIEGCPHEELCFVHLRLRLSKSNALKLYDCFDLKRFVFSQHPDDKKAAALDGFELQVDECRNLLQVEASAALPRPRVVDPTLQASTLRLTGSGKEGKGVDIYAAGVWNVSVEGCYTKELRLHRLNDKVPLTYVGLSVESCDKLKQVCLPRDLNLLKEGELKFSRCDELAKIVLPDQMRCQKASVELFRLHKLSEIVLPARFGPADLGLGGSAVEDSCLELKVEACPRLRSIHTASAPAAQVEQQRPDRTEIRVSGLFSADEVKMTDLKILAAGVSMNITVLFASNINTLFLSPDQRKMKYLTLNIQECKLLEQVCLSDEEVSQEGFYATMLNCKQLKNFILPQLLCKDAELVLGALENLQNLSFESSKWQVSNSLSLLTGVCHKLETICLPKNICCQKAELIFEDLPLLKNFSMPEGWEISQEVKVTFRKCPDLQSFTVPPGFQCSGKFTLDFSGNISMPKLSLQTERCEELEVISPKK